MPTKYPTPDPALFSPKGYPSLREDLRDVVLTEGSDYLKKSSLGKCGRQIQLHHLKEIWTGIWIVKVSRDTDLMQANRIKCGQASKSAWMILDEGAVSVFNSIIQL